MLIIAAGIITAVILIILGVTFIVFGSIILRSRKYEITMLGHKTESKLLISIITIGAIITVLSIILLLFTFFIN